MVAQSTPAPPGIYTVPLTYVLGRKYKAIDILSKIQPEYFRRKFVAKNLRSKMF